MELWNWTPICFVTERLVAGVEKKNHVGQVAMRRQLSHQAQ